jgi:cell division cycle 20-like protein 1, cofactor of APC complex
LDFSPHQSGILITGGGTKDQQICVWNTLTNNHVKTIKVDSQVCKLQFSKNSNQFVSTHGFEKNEIAVWQYKDFTKDAVLSGHESRVLYLAASPDGESIVTGAGDETLKFWKVFPSKKIP